MGRVFQAMLIAFSFVYIETILQLILLTSLHIPLSENMHDLTRALKRAMASMLTIVVSSAVLLCIYCMYQLLYSLNVIVRLLTRYVVDGE
jgi:hypothetical protein